jgi:hypothetical protein
MGAPAKAPFPTCRQSLLPPSRHTAAATGGPSANSCQQPLRSHRRSALPRPLARSALAEPLWSCAEYQRTLGLLPCLRHPLIDTFGNSPIDEQAKILCASHTMLAHRDISRAVIPPLGVLHRRELRDHDSFNWSFTLEQLEWPVHCVEFDVEPRESGWHLFPICLELLPIAYTLANIDKICGHRFLLHFGTVEPFPWRARRTAHD